jgi:hypothetical protein
VFSCFLADVAVSGVERKKLICIAQNGLSGRSKLSG